MTSHIVTQEMIDAYYEYTHLTADRRKFLIKLRQMVEPDQGSSFAPPGTGWSDSRLMGHAGEAKLPQ
jgi:hypothetical protein